VSTVNTNNTLLQVNIPEGARITMSIVGEEDTPTDLTPCAADLLLHRRPGDAGEATRRTVEHMNVDGRRRRVRRGGSR
jgi:hypothetical protein